MDTETEKYKELKKLSRLAKVAGVCNFFFGAGIIFMLILLGSQEDMLIVSLLISLMVGYSWYKGAQLLFMSKEILAFSSVEEYMKHIENESKKDSDLF